MLVETVSFRAVFILLSVIFSVTVETVSFSVYIIIGYIQLQWFSAVFILLLVIFSYSGNGLGSVQCLYYYRLYSVTVETVSSSAVLVALKRAVGVSLQRRV